MSFQARMGPASLHEIAVIEKFNAGGWCAYPFGQGQLPKECRRHLAAFEDGAGRPSLIRWMPDVIAFRQLRSGRTQVVLVDAKVCGDKTPNYSLELSAIETAVVYADKLYTPTFFVFDDWKVLTPREARQRGRQGPDPQAGHGSGTAYVLIPKRWSKPFDHVFRIMAERQAS